MYGYAGKILHVDLNTGNIKTEALDKNFARDYVGGLGFGAKIYLDLIKDNPNFDPLSSDNPFVLMTGPLTGVSMNAVARWTVCAKSPQTGLWGECNIGGYFGAELKFAGYDGIVITGESKTPVYLYIDNDTVEIRDAEKYWGRDVYSTNDDMIMDLKQESSRSGQVFNIGPAGENLVPFASIIHKKGHVAGRTGLGAVWGAKKLKAVFVRGTGKLKTADPDKLAVQKKELKEIYADSIAMAALRAFGTAAHMDVGVISGDIPMKNWQQSEWEHFDDIGPIAYEEQLHAGIGTCFSCGVACKREAEVKEGPYKFAKGPGPEYETVASFGTMCLNSSIQSIGRANDICNRYGMDTITCGATIAFAIECFEKGLINKDDTNGIELTWGNSEAIVAMTEMIGKKEGFGEVLCEGSAKAAEKIGGGSEEFLSTVKGLEAPMHDARYAHGYGLAYAVSPRGACHMASLNYPIESGSMYVPDIPELADDIIESDSDGKAALNIACQDFGMFFSSCAIFCNLGALPLNAEQAVSMVNHVTGFNYTVEEIMSIGRKVWYLKRGLSNLFGARKQDDMLPKRLLTPLPDGPTEGSSPDMDLMLKEFYEMRGINENGLPEKDVLQKNGLEDLADLLY